MIFQESAWNLSLFLNKLKNWTEFDIFNAYLYNNLLCTGVKELPAGSCNTVSKFTYNK